MTREREIEDAGPEDDALDDLLREAMRRTGRLLPLTDKEIEEVEAEGADLAPLPDSLADAGAILARLGGPEPALARAAPRRCPPDDLFAEIFRGRALPDDVSAALSHVRECARCGVRLPRIRREIDAGRRWPFTWRRLGIGCPDDDLLSRWIWNPPSLLDWERVYLAAHVRVSRCAPCRERIRRTRADARRRPGDVVPVSETLRNLTIRSGELPSLPAPEPLAPAGRKGDLLEVTLGRWRVWAKEQPERVWREDLRQFESSFKAPVRGDDLERFLEAAGELMRAAEDGPHRTWLGLADEAQVFELLHGEWLRDRVTLGFAFAKGWSARSVDWLALEAEIAPAVQMARARILEDLRQPSVSTPCLVARVFRSVFLEGRNAVYRASHDSLTDVSRLVRHLLAIECGGDAADPDLVERVSRAVRRKLPARDGPRVPEEKVFELVEQIRGTVRDLLDRNRAGDRVVRRFAEVVFDRLGLSFRLPRIHRLAAGETLADDRLLRLILLDAYTHRTDLDRVDAVLKALRPELPVSLTHLLTRQFVERTRRAYQPKAYLRVFREVMGGRGSL